jgi:hypothetical protein
MEDASCGWHDIQDKITQWSEAQEAQNKKQK